jgi:hypothetical protein
MKRLTKYLVLLAIALLIGLTVSGGTKETAKVAPNTLADPIKIDTGYISGTLIGDVGSVCQDRKSQCEGSGYLAGL